jgi:hypothetical protein
MIFPSKRRRGTTFQVGEGEVQHIWGGVECYISTTLHAAQEILACGDRKGGTSNHCYTIWNINDKQVHHATGELGKREKTITSNFYE